MSRSHGTRRPSNVDFIYSTPHRAPKPAGRVRGRRRIELPTGAVRLGTVPAAKPRTRHLGKLSAGLVLLSAGILAATRSTDPGTPPRTLLATIAPPPVASAPVFFFDDVDDALGERLDTSTAPDIRHRTLDGPDLAALDTTPSTAAASAAPSTASGIRTDAGLGVVANANATNRNATEDEGSVAGKVPETDVAPTSVDAGSAGDPPSPAEPELAVTEMKVAPGDTLSGILNDHGLGSGRMATLLSDELVERHLTTLEVGQELTLTRHPDGRFHGLVTRAGDHTRVRVETDGEGFRVSAEELPLEKERVVTSGTIEQSLYMTAEQAQLKQSTIMTLADIFQWELDFARDIRKGDSFAIVYDRLYRDGEYIGDGDILAAEFERGGRAYRAIRFTAADGTSGYYAPDGSSKRRTFSRHPVDVVRITSKFDPERLHPILHQIRAHRGVDYGAPHGSPIRATADGVVAYAGERGAYGNTVILKHGEHTETLYAHMSRISDKSIEGHRVKQGDVIGYVGRTGRVTGTHLHYEFRVGGEHVDPLTVELPAAAPIASAEREALRDLSDTLLAQMRSVLETPERSLARAEGVSRP